MYKFDPKKVDIYQQIELEKTQAETRLEVQNILCRRGPLNGVEDITSNDLQAFQNPKLYDTFQRAMLFNESPWHGILKTEAKEAGESVRDYVKSNPKAIYMENREIDNIVEALKETNLLDRKLGRAATEKEIRNYAKGEFFIDIIEGINLPSSDQNNKYNNDFLKDSFEKEQKASKSLLNLSSNNLLYDSDVVHFKRMEIDEHYRKTHTKVEDPKIETVALKTETQIKVEDPKIETPQPTKQTITDTATESHNINNHKPEPEKEEIKPKTLGEKFKNATKNFIEKVSDLVNNSNVQTLKSSAANLFNKLADKIDPNEPTSNLSINKSIMEHQKPKEVSQTNAFKPQ